MNDHAIRQRVLDEFEFDPSVSAEAIRVTASGGCITLVGHVHSLAQAVAAEAAARRVDGVRSVTPRLVVRSSMDAHVDDRTLADRARQMLTWDAEVPKHGVCVMVQARWLTISGRVQWHFQRVAAEALLRRLLGIAGVTNLLELEALAVQVSVESTIQRAFDRRNALKDDRIRVSVSVGTAVLEGRVRDWRARAMAERTAWNAPGIVAVDDRLVVN